VSACCRSGSAYRSRAGSSNDAAFLATFVSATVTGILVVATFSASQFGLGRLHDRYLFYVVPLWLVSRFSTRYAMSLSAVSTEVVLNVTAPDGSLTLHSAVYV